MVDLHCHILPGIDDGPEFWEEALEMARIAEADGIKSIVATPHIREKVFSVKFLQQQILMLQHYLKTHNVNLDIYLGGDVSTSLSASEMSKYPINQSRYVLIEFPYTHIPSNAKEIIFNLALVGMVPIITHPERNPSVIENPGVLFSLLNGDVYVQITADSLTGYFGREVEECAHYLLQEKAVHVIASDAHSARYRKPELFKGKSVAEKVVGKENAQLLININPESIIADRKIVSLH